MKRCDNILKNKKFRGCMDKTAFYESGRIYCLHNVNHALDTARIAYIKSLEENAGIDKEIIYAAALIHDVGRCMQYEKGVPHDEASVAIGGEILGECGFDAAETELILNAVSGHRTSGRRSALGGLLYFADKKSRMCMLCRAADSCKWSAEDMNMEAEY